ncbi:hypothetical protein OG730_07460 [Streptomyces sp. NBC_01298]|uniref:hypothetical protein n=1 Tax=Streptomyces sp. NBC_01298 TaxID=2903817 RepID=UPI002E1640B4|nr:hypothetical protein OG730_07460 [Streptomyces sp. NBC_01298]
MTSEPTGQAAGPYDAAFLPRLRMSFRAAREPVIEPVSKFGGQRGLATRYDKTAAIHLAGLRLAAIFIWSAK